MKTVAVESQKAEDTDRPSRKAGAEGLNGSRKGLNDRIRRTEPVITSMPCRAQQIMKQQVNRSFFYINLKKINGGSTVLKFLGGIDTGQGGQKLTGEYFNITH
jgi:hypothetical protein